MIGQRLLGAEPGGQPRPRQFFAQERTRAGYRAAGRLLVPWAVFLSERG
jgi:hypothetical protein